MTMRMISPKLAFNDAAKASVFFGLIRLFELRKKYPDAKDEQLAAVSSVGSADMASADVSSATRIVDQLGEINLENHYLSMREYLTRLLELDQPVWISAAIRGRNSLVSILPPPVLQCFNFARLLENFPDSHAVTWWDTLTASLRAQENLELKYRGREGERLSFEYEVNRLSELGIFTPPRWIAMEDEWAGYDILSYEFSSTGGITNRLIEVKACSGSNLQIFVSRNEWQQALAAQNAYVLHVWHMPTGELVELDWKELQAHIPNDLGNGLWQTVRVDLGQQARRPSGSPKTSVFLTKIY